MKKHWETKISGLIFGIICATSCGAIIVYALIATKGLFAWEFFKFVVGLGVIAIIIGAIGAWFSSKENLRP